MTGDHGPSFEQVAALSQLLADLSPGAQRAVGELAKLPPSLAVLEVRSEVRGYLIACADAGVDPVGVERARAVLAAYEGVLGLPSSEEGVRRIA
jgi:hypothetical protein